MKTVDIAMATYNGENFLEEQILSIQKQTYTDWNLYISDDGSSDSTVNIVLKMANKDHRIKLINTERQGGVINNFNCALEHTVSEYIALSDQDDIWPENRLELLVSEIQRYEIAQPNQCILVFSDLELIDQNGKIIADSFYQANRLNPHNNLKDYNLIWTSSVYGCTTIMNRKLLHIALPIPKMAQMHDQWLALKAQKNNGLYYFNFKSIKYRQHANNVVGGSNNGLFAKLKGFSKSFKNIKISVLKTKQILRDEPEIYKKGVVFFTYSDLLKFALREILPNLLFGDKKMQSFFIFIVFLLV